jgi:AMIN domain
MKPISVRSVCFHGAFFYGAFPHACTLIAVPVLASCSVALVSQSSVPSAHAEAKGESYSLSAESLSAESGPTSIHVNDSLSQTIISLKSPYISGEGKSFFLPSPPRLVIDIPGNDWTHLQKTLALSKSEVASAVRVATYPKKMRVVVDLTTNQAPEVKSSREGEILRLALAPRDASTRARLASKNVKSVSEKAERDSASPMMGNKSNQGIGHLESSSEAGEDSFKKVEGESREVVRGSSTASLVANEARSNHEARSNNEAPAVIDSTESLPVLAAIKFVSLSPSQTKAVRLELSSLSQFTLTKKDDTSYLLKLPNATLNDSVLALPYYPPRDFTGLTVVLAKEVNDGVEITIGVDQGMSLLAAPKGTSIWIKSAED